MTKTADAPVSLLIVGIGGMGSVYVRELLEKRAEGKFRIAGAVDPVPKRGPQLEDLKALGVPTFGAVENFYRNRTAELAIVSSPIQFHCSQTRIAVSKGSHVLCEKPAAATIQEVRKMIEAEKKARRWVAVGYQWSFSSAVQTLKEDISRGLLGKPKRLKCLYLWPRDEAYYRRNDWAGKARDSAGDWILDSPANNAMAHDLHNMFYILGEDKHSSAIPVEVVAELYRANEVENFDTAAARALTETGVEILFFVSHASRHQKGPLFLYEFERGVVRCASRDSGITAEFVNGKKKSYGVPDREPMVKLWNSIESVRDGGRPLCGLEAAASQTLCLNGMQDSMPEIRPFPADTIQGEEGHGTRRLWVEGLDEGLEACFERNALPSELGLSWAAGGRKVDLRDYPSYPHGRES